LSALPLPFYDNPLLFGHHPIPGLVAFEPLDIATRVYARMPRGLAVTEQPLRPFLLLGDPDLLRGFKGAVDIAPLEGPGV
jgi:DNA polymerase I